MCVVDDGRAGFAGEGQATLAVCGRLKSRSMIREGELSRGHMDLQMPSVFD